MDIKIIVGKRLKELRLSKSLSQESLAFQANVDRTYINSVENGRRNISVQTLQKLLVGLNISFSDFFNNEAFHI